MICSLKRHTWLRWLSVCALFIFALGIQAILLAQSSRVHVFAQTGSACGPAGGHCTVLTWTASASAAGCISPCILEYNVHRGTAAGAEGSAPINASLISGLTYTDPVTLTSNSQTFFYTVEVVETSGGITDNSGPSNEVSVTFPGLPAPATGLSGVGH